jgi:glycosyltransferase involved in cell wall biosynthesis
MLPRSAKSVGLFYHFDPALDAKTAVDRWAARRLWAGLKQCDRVVVIAQCWREMLRDHGIQDARVIHCGLDVNATRFDREAVGRFRQRHAFVGRPLIYLGNCRPHKGVAEAWEALRHMDADFVTSGPWSLQVPVRNFNGAREDYLLLLAAADVVLTMSMFDEGWNISAHEAMLVGTPVVGSGRGGMAELLQGGGQLICRSFEQLPEYVTAALHNRQALGRRGREFAETFSVSRFTRAWLSLIEELEAPDTLGARGS